MTIPRLPGWLTPFVTRSIHVVARWTRPLTIGVRAVICDPEGRVFLVRHSYIRGWHLPGGAVEAGETVRDALRREIREEANIDIDGSPVLHGVFFNRRASRRDHVLVFVVKDYRTIGVNEPGLEIVDSGFFLPERLPAGTTAATRARLDEVIQGRQAASDW